MKHKNKFMFKVTTILEVNNMNSKSYPNTQSSSKKKSWWVSLMARTPQNQNVSKPLTNSQGSISLEYNIVENLKDIEENISILDVCNIS